MKQDDVEKLASEWLIRELKKGWADEDVYYLIGLFEQAKQMELKAKENTYTEEQVEENYSNEAGHEEMAKLKALLSMGNDMHKMKHSQAVGNPTQVTFETTLLKDATSLHQKSKVVPFPCR